MNSEQSMTNQFEFQQFTVIQEKSTMKVNTDGILLGAWVDLVDCDTVLDIGTGTGLIAMMVAQRSGCPEIVGIEIDADAYSEAKLNASNCSYASRLAMVHSSIQDFAMQSKQSFDHIISNPPFFSGGTFSTNENKNNVRHTVKLSHQDLIRSVIKLISKAGKFSVILPNLEGLRFIELVERAGLDLKRHTEVYGKPSKGVERRLLTFSRTGEFSGLDCIYTYNEDGSYHNDYKELTKVFYLEGRLD